MYQPETEYYLGQNEQNGYTIVEHINHRFPHEGRCVFSVCEYGVSDGSGAPISYDDTYVEIEEDVRKQAYSTPDRKDGRQTHHPCGRLRTGRG